MEEKIREHIEHPELLEELYRTDKKGFQKAFFHVYPEISDTRIAEFWKTRLSFDSPKRIQEKEWKTDIILLVITCIVTGFLIKLPFIFNIQTNDISFYEKNAGLIMLFGLSMYSFLTKPQVNIKHLITTASVFIVSAIYINVLPSDRESQSIRLAYIHLPLLLWCIYGLIFIDFNRENKPMRIDYIKHNGDLAILTAIILISGGILTGVTLQLFSAIDLNIERFYQDYIIIPGMVCTPIVATFIIKSFPAIANKIAPVIAMIFSPVVLITLVIYLASIALTGKDPYNDRDFLIVFNLLLIGVMAIITFAVSEVSIYKKLRFNKWILFTLSIVTLIIDVVALSAIIYRMGEFGLTPNRVAVLGSNILIFINLALIMVHLYKVIFKANDIRTVELRVAKYLPFYMAWAFFMTFILPFIFGFK